MSLDKTRIGDKAQGLTEPFVMLPVARVDHFTVFVYLCTGFVGRHRHVTQDELFYVYDGLLSLETDWGRAILSRDELTVIPSGLSHQSGSLIRTIVLRFAAHSDPDRKNGHGRLSLENDLEALPKWSVERQAQIVYRDYLPLPMAEVDEMCLRLVRCQGETPWHRHLDHDEMLWVRQGSLEIGTENGPTTLESDELTVLPRGLIHRLSARERSLAVSFIHGEVSAEAHMGLDGQTGL
ncbi:MAG: hypothetical protein FJZ90_11770 [Chloroflexi bacterium]|nr:hypothetical protein [Chloroflexota bacterium]